MDFVDWNWLPYTVLRVKPEQKRQQERLLWGTGLCEGEDGLEYSFIPTKDMEHLENQLCLLYQDLPLAQLALCQEVYNSSKIEGAEITLQRVQQL